MGSASLQRQQTAVHVTVALQVLHPALAFELCGVSQTLLLESLCAALFGLLSTDQREINMLPALAQNNIFEVLQSS